MSETRCNHLSASSIASFKACPQRYRLAYVEGIRPAEDTESLRMGTNWHALHEVYADLIQRNATATHRTSPYTKEECEGGALTGVIEHLNERYANMPNGFDKTKWELERQILLTCFIGYLWRWQNDPIEFLASEVPFNLPLHMPRSGMPISMDEVQRVGKIDHIIIKWDGAICALERKSTSRTIAPDSDYWERSAKDTQVSMYALAFKDMVERDSAGDVKLLDAGGATWHIEEDTRFGNTLYDVWHKPTIKPCMLTQKETREFIDSGKYNGQEFKVMVSVACDKVFVNAVEAEIEQGKKAIAIRETVEMYAARLLADIQERPDFYFQRKEIVRTDAELKEFRKELYGIYTAQRLYKENDCWFSNESACRATFKCQYVPICYGPGAASVCDGKTTPEGFKRLFKVDLTIEGSVVELED